MNPKHQNIWPKVEKNASGKRIPCRAARTPLSVNCQHGFKGFCLYKWARGETNLTHYHQCVNKPSLASIDTTHTHTWGCTLLGHHTSQTDMLWWTALSASLSTASWVHYSHLITQTNLKRVLETWTVAVKSTMVINTFMMSNFLCFRLIQCQ